MHALRHIHDRAIALATLLAAVMLCSVSCVFDYDECPEPEEESITFINVDISLPQIPGTRTPSGEYDPGSAEWENWIDLDDMRFYIFSGTPDAAGQYEFVYALDPVCTIIEPDGTDDRGSNYKRYKMSSIIHKQLNMPIKVMVLANCGRYTAYPAVDANGHLKLGSITVNSIDALCSSLTYSLTTPLTALDHDRLIPMFGITHVTESNVDGTRIDAGTIHMLRAMAKVEVKPLEGERAIESAQLVGFNSGGLCAPTNVYSKADYVTDSWSSDYVGHVSLAGGADHNENETGYLSRTCSFAPQSDGSYIIYVPEFNMIDVSDKPYINIKFIDESADYQIYFKDYSTDEPFNINRNVYYRYEASRKGTKVTVVPYAEVKLEPTFGVRVPYIRLNANAVNMFPNARLTLRALLVNFPSGSQSVTWTVSDPSAVELSYTDPDTGVTSVISSEATIPTDADHLCYISLLALHKGEIQVTASSDILSAVCYITIAEERIILDKVWLEMHEGDVATVKPELCFDTEHLIIGSGGADKGITWDIINVQPADPGYDVASVQTVVDAEGNYTASVTALHAGRATLRGQHLIARPTEFGGDVNLVTYCTINVTP